MFLSCSKIVQCNSILSSLALQNLDIYPSSYSISCSFSGILQWGNVNFQSFGQKGERIWNFKGSGTIDSSSSSVLLPLSLTYRIVSEKDIGFTGPVTGLLESNISQESLNATSYVKYKHSYNPTTQEVEIIFFIELNKETKKWSYDLWVKDSNASSPSIYTSLDYGTSSQNSYYTYSSKNNTLNFFPPQTDSSANFYFSISDILVNNIFSVSIVYYQNFSQLIIQDNSGHSLLIYDNTSSSDPDPYNLLYHNTNQFIYEGEYWVGPKYLPGDMSEINNIDFSISYDNSNNKYYYNVYGYYNPVDGSSSLFTIWTPPPGISFSTNVWNYQIIDFFQYPETPLTIINVGNIKYLQISCFNDSSLNTISLELPSGYSLDGSGLVLDSSNNTYKYNCGNGITLATISSQQ